MRNKNLFLLLALGFLLLVAVGGCAPAAPEERQCAPGVSIPISPEAAQRLEDKIRREILEKPSPDFRVEATQEEVTSWLALNIQDYPITQPRIAFLPGLICLSGELTGLGPLKGTLVVALSASLSEGKPVIQVEWAALGSLSIPAPLRSLITNMINDSIQEVRWEGAITELQILQGRLIVAGRKLS